MTLSLRINVTVFVLLVVILSVFGWLQIQEEREHLDVQLEREGRSMAESVATYSIDPILLEDYPVLEAVLLSLAKNNSEILSVEVYKGDVVVASYRSKKNLTGIKFVADILIEDIEESDRSKLGEVHLVLSEEMHIDLEDHRLNDVVYLFSLTFLTLLCAISLLINISVVRRIKRLSLYAAKIEDGESTQELSILGDKEAIASRHQDEIDKLSNSLGSMHMSIEERQKLLLNYNEGLEQAIRQRTGELNEAKDRAESSDRAKSAFLANMSHEVRTPMNGIMTMAEILLRSDLNDAQRTNVRNIHSSCQSLVTVLNDVLDFSKIESGTIDLNSQKFSMQELLGEIDTLFRDQIERKGLTFDLEEGTDIPRYLKADPARLRQVLINLLSNAVNFTVQGRIALIISRVVATNQGFARLKFEIVDTGCGISEQNKKKIFERFSQVDESYSRVKGGSGLGLAIITQVLEKMGGSIGVESELGKGSNFWFELELEEVDEDKNEPDFEKIKQPNGVVNRILLVEDEPISRIGCQTLLEAEGYVVDVAENGSEALEILKSYSHDLVVMDVHMPVMDGLEATRRIRQKKLAIPILGFTASVTKDEHELYLAAGMNGVVAKPLDIKVLTREISKLVSKETKQVS